MTEEQKPLRIVHLIAENIGKLRAIEITPTGEVVTIAGRNDQGKSTVLNSIFMALEHTWIPVVMPVRKGETKGRIRVDMGEIIVERRFTEKGSSLFVENAKGARFTSPQKVIDALIGKLSFDPLAFSRMDPEDQFDELRRVAHLDTDIVELDRLNAGDYARRTDLNRDAKSKRNQADAIVVAVGLPDEPLDEAALLQEMETAAATNSELEQRKARREQAQRDATEFRKSAATLRDRAADLRAQADSADRDAAEHEEKAATIEKRLADAEAIPAPVDVSGIRVKIEQARITNALLQARDRKAVLIAEAELIESQAKDRTTAMEAREKAKAAAIAAAKMPVEGLGFGPGEPHITYNGIPFAQASSSVKLKVSLAIAMAANPTLRVIRIQDASLLDEQSMAEISAMAKDKGYQLWCEVVDTSGKVGVVIEDGAVVSVDGKPVAKAEATA